MTEAQINIIQAIKAEAAAILPRLIAFRRHMHMYPELSFQETETAIFIKEQLSEAGFEQVKSIARTGLSALITGNGAGETIALRADIDALPIQEREGREYGSKYAGIMHACGHDVHSASMFGAALILKKLKQQWPGVVKLIFQPGEEKAPGGASVLIKEGILKDPDVRAIFGQHVMPLLPVGTVGFRGGKYMASADEIYMTISGKGGHGAMPHKGNDTVLAMAHIITGLQQIISRRADPTIPSVLSFGKVIANGATNVLPNKVTIEGTFRTLDDTWREAALLLIQKTATAIGEAMGVAVEVNFVRGYPALVNDEPLTKQAQANARDYLGVENVVDLDIWMASEDFSFYGKEIPGCFYRLGTRNEEKGITALVHTPDFDIDERALEIGAGLMAYLTFSHLWKKS